MSLLDNYNLIEKKIVEACKRSNRSRDQINLIAVSKSQPLELMLEFEKISKAPVVFGENYVQELESKVHSLSKTSEIHFIGGLQTNKAKEAVKLAQVIESVDSEKLIEVIAKEAAKIEKSQQIFLQVNISDDPQKRGFNVNTIHSAYEKCKQYPQIYVLGLMAITELYQNTEEVRPDFQKLRLLRDKIDPKLFLSMGMSSDFEIAIEEGATHIRIGSALFGER